MPQFYDSIPDHLRDWALEQQVFFTASAPLVGRHINISPKGLPASTFTIFDSNHAAYIDATGSGVETISHLYENARITIMFCSFATSPRIVRFFCTGRVVEWDDPAFSPLLQRMGKKKVEGARAVILLDVFKAQSSCGFGVPLLTLTFTHDESLESARPTLKDRETMGHWAEKMVEKDALEEYRAKWNAGSLDGLTGLRAARRRKGERMWVTGMKARWRRVMGQREACLWGGVVGMVGMWFLMKIYERMKGVW